MQKKKKKFSMLSIAFCHEEETDCVMLGLAKIHDKVEELFQILASAATSNV